jgi:dTDP-4-dehydrorhamnose reductase
LVGTGCSRPVPTGNWKDAPLDVLSQGRVDDLVARIRPAAVIYTSYRLGDPAITVDGARFAARAAARAGARFVFLSTDHVFGGDAGNYDESARAVPLSAYGGMKLQAEGQVWIEHEEAVILRPALMVGASAQHQRPLFECELLARGLECSLFSDEWRSPVHVDDVARAVWDLVSLNVRGVYHLGGPARLSRLELGRLLCALYGFDPRLLVEAQRPPDRPRDLSLNSTRIAALLGWAPRPLDAPAPQREFASSL